MLRKREVTPGVFYAADSLVVVGSDDIDALVAGVSTTPLKRSRLCVHETAQTPLQEMFIVLARETYIRPHRHTAKAESLLVLQGDADAVFFDQAGAITNVVALGPLNLGSRFFYRIDAAIYHTLLIHSDTFVFKEATIGPFDNAASEFAPWAPAAGDAEAARAYSEELAAAVRTFRRPE